MKTSLIALAPRSRGLLLGFAIVLCVLTGASLSAALGKSVAVSATAVPNYIRALGADGKPLPESYVFTEGRFFGGRTADSSLKQVRFEDIIKMLAPNLAKQNYLPTKDVPSANLLLMVHWGTTSVYEDPQEATAMDDLNAALTEYRDAVAANGGIADPSALNAELSARNYSSSSAAGAIARNSALLGYKPELEQQQRKLFVSADEQTMNAELNEERYFVILMAYDYQLLLREKKSRLLWVTRISVRSPGDNFLNAVPAIAEAGAEAYGRQIDGLVRVKTSARSGRVELGELKNLGAETTTPPAAK